MKQTLHTLQNGLRVLLCEDHFSPIVSIQIWVNAGSADETPTQAGLAHIHEHMLFKGTARRPVGSIAAEIEGAGGDINAFTSHDQTCYYVSMASRYFDTGLDVLSDALLNSAFEPDELRRECAVILEELAGINDAPMHKLSDASFAKAYSHHPYGRPIIGRKEVIENVKRKDVLSFYKRHYRPDNMFLVVVGDIDAGRAIRKIQTHFKGFSAPTYRRAPRTVEPEQQALRTALLFDPIHEATFSALFHIPSLFHPDSPALDLFGMILGTGDSSRLHRRLWEQESAASASWASAYLPKDPGIFSAGFVAEPDRFEKALGCLFEEIFLFARHPPTPEELAKTRRMAEADYLHAMETYSGRARRLGHSMCIAGRPDIEEEYLKRVTAVTIQDISRVARTYFTPKNLTCALIAPRESKKSIRSSIIKQIVQNAFSKASSMPPVVTNPSEPVAESPLPIRGIFAKRKRIKRYVLSNGIRLIVAENPNTPVFSVRLALLGGRLYEPVHGLSNFCSAMLTKGTRQKDAEAFARTVDSMAAHLGSFSGLNTLGLAGDFISRDLHEGIDLICEVLLEPAFAEDQIEKTRDELKFDLKTREDKLAHRLFDLFHETLYPNHPYGLYKLGTAQSLDSITRKKLQGFWKRVMTPESLVICLSGDVPPDQTARRFEDRLSSLRAQPPFSLPSAVSPPPGPRIARMEKPKEQTHIALGFLGVDNRSRDRFALEALMAVMSGQGGRLFLELRDRLHLAYSISGFHTQGIGTGSLGFYMSTNPTRGEEAVLALKDQVIRLWEKGVSPGELARAQRYLIGNFEIDLAGNSSMAQQICLSELYGLGHAAHRQYARKILAVSPGQIQKVIEKYLNLDNSVLAMITSNGKSL